MDASLDTNVIIHLYNANYQSLLFNRFESLKVYEFIRSVEMENHASKEIKNKFDEDIRNGNISIITDDYLKSIGMYEIFMEHVKDIKYLYEVGDLGEVFAIALATTLGYAILITDDIKDRGPHYTLMRTLDTDILPFAFYEILFLDYLDSKTNENQLVNQFNTINEISNLNMNLSSKVKKFINRFWISPYCEREREWMRNYCNNNNINARQKIQNLNVYLGSHGII